MNVNNIIKTICVDYNIDMNGFKEDLNKGSNFYVFNREFLKNLYSFK